MVTAIPAPGTIPEITFNSVSKHYRKGTLALQNISLTIERGEFLSLLGPSGCGKSTLLRLIAGLTHSSQGSITVNGITPANARDLMGFIFQDAALLPWRTIEQNVGLALELEHAARPKRHEQITRVLETVGLTHAAKQYPRQLSGGMKMRASIARALIGRPRILLLDEPFAALDEMSRDRLNDEILRLYEEQHWTVVFVTHSVQESVFLSKRIVILAPHPGRIAHDIEVQLPWPRTPEMRTSSAYEQEVLRISRLLRSVHPMHQEQSA